MQDIIGPPLLETYFSDFTTQKITDILQDELLHRKIPIEISTQIADFQAYLEKQDITIFRRIKSAHEL